MRAVTSSVRIRSRSNTGIVPSGIEAFRSCLRRIVGHRCFLHTANLMFAFTLTSGAVIAEAEQLQPFNAWRAGCSGTVRHPRSSAEPLPRFFCSRRLLLVRRLRENTRLNTQIDIKRVSSSDAHGTPPFLKFLYGTALMMPPARIRQRFALNYEAR